MNLQGDIIAITDTNGDVVARYTDCTTEMHDLTEREAFMRGFILGARIMIEVLTSKSDS